MKKRYEKPHMEVMQIGVSQFLCYSGGLSAPAYNNYGFEDNDE